MFGRVEGVERFRTNLVGHSRSAIGDGNPAPPVSAPDADIDSSLTFHRLRRVHQDVLKYHLQHFAIPGDIAGTTDVDREVRHGRVALDERGRVAEQGGQRYR